MLHVTDETFAILRHAGHASYLLDEDAMEDATIVVAVALLWHGAVEEEVYCASWNEARTVGLTIRAHYDFYEYREALSIVLSEQYAEGGGATGYATDEEL